MTLLDQKALRRGQSFELVFDIHAGYLGAISVILGLPQYQNRGQEAATMRCAGRLRGKARLA